MKAIAYHFLMFITAICSQSSPIPSCPPAPIEPKVISIPFVSDDITQMIAKYNGVEDLTHQANALFGVSGQFYIERAHYYPDSKSLIILVVCDDGTISASGINASITTAICVNSKTRETHYFRLPNKPQTANTRIIGTFTIGPTKCGIAIKIASKTKSPKDDKYALVIWNIDKHIVERIIDWIPIAEPLSGINFGLWCIDVNKSAVSVPNINWSEPDEPRLDLILKSSQTSNLVTLTPPIEMILDYRLIACEDPHQFIEYKTSPKLSMTCYDSRTPDSVKWRMDPNYIRREFRLLDEPWIIGGSSQPSAYSLLAASHVNDESLVLLMRNNDGQIITTWKGDDEWCCLGRECLMSQNGKTCYLSTSQGDGHVCIREFDIDKKQMGRILLGEEYYGLELIAITATGTIIGFDVDSVLEFNGSDPPKELFLLDD